MPTEAELDWIMAVRTAPAATPCAVYTVSGACVASGSGESTFEVTAGIYIVRAGDRSFKVAVR